MFSVASGPLPLKEAWLLSVRTQSLPSVYEIRHDIITISKHGMWEKGNLGVQVQHQKELNYRSLRLVKRLKHKT